jgi:alpha-beta hydrolase superfamily lysophospholipase
MAVAPLLDVRPFKLEVSDEAIADLQARLTLTRLPDVGPASDSWIMGSPRTVVADLLAHWREEFDWRTAEAALNAMPQYTANVPTTAEYSDAAPMNVHFVHQRSSAADATPLLLLHCWPGCECGAQP